MEMAIEDAEMGAAHLRRDSDICRAAGVRRDVIAICNNVGEAAFLGPNQKIENPLPRAS